MASIGPPALGAKGCGERLHPTGETTHYDLCVAGAPSNHVRCASLRSGGRRLAVRKTIEYQIGALPRTPFPAAREFPSRGNKKFEEKNRESYTSCTTPTFSLWWLAPPPFPRSSVGRQKESALMGRLGALLRPTWRSYAGPPQWHNKSQIPTPKSIFFPTVSGQWVAGSRDLSLPVISSEAKRSREISPH